MIEKFSVGSWRFLRRLLVLLVYFSLGLCLVYSLFYLASYFSLSFFVLSHRGMVEQAVSSNILSGPWDIVIWGCAVFVVLAWICYDLGSGLIQGYYRLQWGIGLFCVLCGLVVWVCLVVFGLVSLVSLVLVSCLLLGLCVVFSFDFFDVHRLGLFLRLLFGGFLLVLFVELAALFLFNVPTVLNLSPQLSDAALHWSSVESSFSNLAYPFLPFVYLLFVLFGVGAFVFRVLPDGWLWLVGRVRAGWFVRRLSGLFEFGEGFGFLRSRLVVVLAVVVSAVVSCLFVLFTVLPWSNPTSMLVSADSPVYYNWISHMRSVDVNSALSFAFGNDRALFLVLCYALSFFTSTTNVIQFVGALLIVLFGVVSLLMLRLFCKVRTVWVFGVLLVPFSFQSLGLIYSGYFANMLALILIFVYVVLFFKVLDSWSSLGFFTLLGVSVLVLFSHSWTWFIFALSLGAFVFLEWLLAVRDKSLWRRFKLKATFVAATVGVGLFCDFIRKMLSPVSASASVFATAQSSLGLPNGAYLLSGLRNSVDFVLGGVFANQLLVFLSLVGFLFLLKFKSEVSNFVISWIFVGCMCILFASENFVFDRLLFFMPWVVLSSVGLYYIVNIVNSRLGGWKCWRLGFAAIILVIVFLVLLNGSLRYLFNINIW